MDRDLVKLLHEYAQLQRTIEPAAASTGGPLYDLATEQLAVQQAVESKKGPLPERAVRAIFRELHSGVRALVKPLRVAYLGPTYSYSHLAAIERFGSSAELVPVATIAAVFEEVNRKQVDFGVVPIENSTDGRIVDTLGMFTRLPVRICGEVQLRIHHYLLGRCERADINEVYSKPQALSQCRDWLAKHLPSARMVEMTSTAAAAQLAAEKPGAAAIASLQAATNYGLNVDRREHRRQPEQHHPLCRHQRSRRAADRPRQDGADVRDRPRPRLAGRRDGHFQAQSAEPDLDRIVPHAQHGEGVPVLRRVGGPSRGHEDQAARWRPCGGRPSAWKSWGVPTGEPVESP